MLLKQLVASLYHAVGVGNGHLLFRFGSLSLQRPMGGRTLGEMEQIQVCHEFQL